MGTYTKNLKLETPSYTDNADIPALAKKNNEIIDSEMIKRANGLDYNEQTGVLQLTGNNSKVGSPIQIKNNLPVTSMASGTELKVNNYKQLIKFTKEGKSTQETRSGKNLLRFNSSTQTINGLKITITNDGIITLNGTTTDVVSIKLSTSTYNLKAGSYYLARNETGSVSGTFDNILYGKNGTTVHICSLTSEGRIVTTTTDYQEYYLWLYINSIGTTFTNYTMKPQLETGTVKTDWEQYGVSPSPDYPQKIENLSGVENLLNIPDGTYESNGITAIAKGGVVTLNGTATANSFISIPFNYTFLANINYTLSANNTLTMGGENYIRFNYGTTVYFPCRFFYEKSKFTNNFNENTIVNAFTIRTESGKTYNNFVIKPQLEEGQIAHNFVPNGSNYLQLKNTTDNKSKIINVDLKGNNLCSNKDKSVKDELLVENGKAKIYKKIKEVVLTGNENIVSDGKTSNYYRYKIVINSETFLNYPTALCTHFIYNLSYTADAPHFYILKTDEMLFFSDKSTLDEFKNWLKVQYNAGTPVKVQYELAEPEVIDLGEVDFDLIENSTLTCEDESNMQLDYLTIDSNIFVQDSLDGSSSQKAPSVDAVNKAINKISNYSSEEQCIGEWFGEKHYRKVFKIDMDSTSKEMTIPTGIDMKQLTHAYGVALYNGTIYLPLNFYNNLGWDSFHLTGKGANIILQRGDNFSITKVFITLEYTKNV